MDPATTSGVVDRLKDRGLVTLSPDPNDRRRVIVELEPRGRKLVEDMLPVLEQLAEATMDRLTVAEKVALIYLLEKISETDADGAADN
jgi:DNA-binding MarR family transcriptional regulator